MCSTRAASSESSELTVSAIGPERIPLGAQLRDALEERNDLARCDVVGDGLDAVADAALDVAILGPGRGLRRAARGGGLVRFPTFAAILAAPRRDADDDRARDVGHRSS